MKRYPALFLACFVLLPLVNRAEENPRPQKKATLVVEYGLDSLERRYYRPSFRFDFPFKGGSWFSEVQYISRMNGRMQGAIDYWVNAGMQKAIGEKLQLELRLNHFCRHETLRDTLYVWSINEVLARVGLAGKKFNLAVAAGPYIGSSPGYRELLVFNGEWRGALFPELSLFAELKLVNFARLYYEAGFYLALNRNVDIFFKNTRHYEFPNTSYLGLRYRSGDGDSALLDTMKMLAGVSPFDKRFKLEVEGEFKLEFFRNESRRVTLGIDFETPVLNGDSFFGQFWPARMYYAFGLDYEKKLAPRLFAAWVAWYRLALPVDKDRPFTASLFTGLALRSQPDFDVLGRDVRFEVAAGYNFKRGLEFDGKLGLRIWGNDSLSLFTEMKSQVDDKRIHLDLRLLASTGGRVELRPYVGWKKDIQLQSGQGAPGRFLFGLGFFKKF
ncbi:MAG TPA: hypothetical protein VF451_04120 [Acidobacteriota bacterium]